MPDGLTLNDVWVSPADELRLTLQANDLQKPATLQTSYSSSFVLPDSLTVRRVTEGAEATNSDSRIPFTLLPSRLTQSGIMTFDGFARFIEYQSDEGWHLNLIDKNRALYTRLDRSLRTLDLSRWAFRWNVDSVLAASTQTEGYCFPLVDYGAIENGGQAADLLLPAVFVRTLLQTMLREEGYDLEWPADGVYGEFLSALTLPMASARPLLALNEQFVADRQARAGIEIKSGVFIVSHGKDFTVAVPFNSVDRPSLGFSQGRLGNYRADLVGYVVDTPMRLAVKVNLSHRLKVTSGGVRITFQMLKNGAVIKQQEYEQGGPSNLFLLNYRSFEWEETIDVVAGDRITFQLIGRQFTFLGGWEFILDDERSSVTFAPDISVRYGDPYPLAANLPDMTCLELLKSAALACCGTYLIDDITRSLRFVPLSPLVADQAGAADWSERLDEEGDCRYTPSIEPYAQKNTLAYKQKNESDTQGNGILTISASALAEQVTLFTLPFGPVPVSKTTIGAINAIPRIELRTIERNTDGTTTVLDKVAENGPHWLLVHPTLTQTMETLETKAGVNRKVSVPLRVAWFDTRPDLLKTRPGLNMNLSFDDPAATERGLISLFFAGLKQVLDRPRTLELTVLLSPTVISSLRLDKLVYIHAQNIGGLSLPPTYYYISKIENYQPDVPCTVTLIAAS
ncbi:hypothetical protein A6C57_01110 [Fibrella sp. ES10-3-2-2]